MDTQKGTISAVGGLYVFLTNADHESIYAPRDQLTFDNPTIGMKVQFELLIRPGRPRPTAWHVRPVE